MNLLTVKAHREPVRPVFFTLGDDYEPSPGRTWHEVYVEATVLVEDHVPMLVRVGRWLRNRLRLDIENDES